MRATAACSTPRTQVTAITKVVGSVRPLPGRTGGAGPFEAPVRISRDGTIGLASLRLDKPAPDLDKARTRRVVDVARAGATRDLEVNLGGRRSPRC